MKTALITGITGQDGAYLSQFLISKNYRVIGVVRKQSKLHNLFYLGIHSKIILEKVDLLDQNQIMILFSKYAIDEVYHLAAQSSVGLSFDKPVDTLSFNIVSTGNLLEVIRLKYNKISFFHPSSSEMFGNVSAEELPITETSHLQPLSPYSISKSASHWMVKNYRESYNLFVSCGILFNHESVLRGKNFVTKKIINTAVKIHMGIAKTLELGNLKIYRDWGYAPYYVRAIWAILQQPHADDYVVCSGEAHSLEHFTRVVFAHLNLNFEKHVRVNKQFYRPTDIDIIYGDNSKAKKILGWEYKISFDTFINLLIQDELKFVQITN